MGGGGEEPLHVLGGAGVARTGAWAWSTLNKAELGTRLVLLKLKENRVKIVEIENLICNSRFWLQGELRLN